MTKYHIMYEHREVVLGSPAISVLPSGTVALSAQPARKVQVYRREVLKVDKPLIEQEDFKSAATKVVAEAMTDELGTHTSKEEIVDRVKDGELYAEERIGNGWQPFGIPKVSIGKLLEQEVK